MIKQKRATWVKCGDVTNDSALDLVANVRTGDIKVRTIANGVREEPNPDSQMYEVYLNALIKQRKAVNHLIQQDIADYLGVHKNTVQHWEDSKYVPRYRHWLKLVELFGNVVLVGGKRVIVTYK